ncbi:hypothetical protein SAMN05444359_13813 [Neolewinella agarilytica]|uniref:Uncharacterized protein n=1 Tax=Neolewinella agarilytica TaxID=478744 RepID=A0A1H9NMA8_9BACT|nr:hypothetical protein SAMN05444359_13813 [Neolewinella agarilytica]
MYHFGRYFLLDYDLAICIQIRLVFPLHGPARGTKLFINLVTSNLLRVLVHEVVS